VDKMIKPEIGLVRVAEIMREDEQYRNGRDEVKLCIYCGKRLNRYNGHEKCAQCWTKGCSWDGGIKDEGHNNRHQKLTAADGLYITSMRTKKSRMKSCLTE
jgi:hypothetical protein